MANFSLGRIRRAGQEKSVPTHWDFERSQSENVEDIEGVGRAGAPGDAQAVLVKMVEAVRGLGTSAA